MCEPGHGQPTKADAARVPPLELPHIPMPPAIPELLRLGGSDHFEAYREIFDRIFRDPAILLFDPQGRAILFAADACKHICFHEERFDRARKRAEGEPRSRMIWDQECAEHIPWLLPALIAPSLIVRNNQVRGNLAYLLGFPTGNFNRPDRRYYVSVRPENPKATRVLFKTAYPISQRQWDDATRGWPGQGPHVLYKGKSPRR